jgi:hypothetical protein
VEAKQLDEGIGDTFVSVDADGSLLIFETEKKWIVREWAMPSE